MTKKHYNYLLVSNVVLNLLTIIAWYLWVFAVPTKDINTWVRFGISFGFGNAIALAVASLAERYSDYQEAGIRFWLSDQREHIANVTKELTLNGHGA